MLPVGVMFFVVFVVDSPRFVLRRHHEPLIIELPTSQKAERTLLSKKYRHVLRILLKFRS
jgi:vacuolar-type H+-ATPase subunit F/Vma7